jgi:DNA replication licensing factor MCM2
LLFNRDYETNERLDRYEEQGVDDDDYDPLDLATRNVVDNQLNRRDAEIQRRGRIAGAFMEGLEDEETNVLPTTHRRRRVYDTQAYEEEEEGVVRNYCYYYFNIDILIGIYSLK